ncbi:MAG TPA: polysaccharide deacetylase family protein [Gemmataceae bacterium]|jgi:polysaccharide deacetylase family protein (PEP-CTERM system associated)|nr:polysaccharide deacetylase family protein [Gemmataceae bacterium]
MPVCFTFDIEEHDRIEAAVGFDCPSHLKVDYARRMETCTRWIVETLDRVGAKATFFIVGQIAVTHPRLVRDIAEAGHEIACHSWDHRRVHHFTPATFREDLRRAVNALEQAGGVRVVGFRAPTFSIVRETAWAIDVLAEEGIRYDSSVFPVRHDRYGVPDAPRVPFLVEGRERSLLELPPVTLRVGPVNLPAAGGGYFRLFPTALMRAAIRQAGASVLYFHPWEFDPHQPRLPLGEFAKFRSYVGIPRARSRLCKLISRYGSRRLIDVVGELNPQQLSTFRLATSS